MKLFYFKLYASIIPVRGKHRSALYDLDGQTIHIIPQVIYDLLQWLKQYPPEHIGRCFPPGAEKLLQEAVRKMERNDWGFYTDEPERFPPLSLQWHCPARIQIAVIEYAFQHYTLEPVIQQLDELLCQHVEIRVMAVRSEKSGYAQRIFRLLELLEQKTIRSATLLIPYAELDLTTVSGLFRQCPKLYRCILYEAPVDKRYDLGKNEQVFLVSRALHTPYPSIPRYIVNREFFCESLRYNPWYNRKVCIDRYGNIKSDLKHPQSFGRLPMQTLEQVISLPGFRALWHAGPDKIPSAKHSELRYAMIHRLSGTTRPGSPGW